MIQLEVWGPYALFSRPEFKTERVSFEAPTPSAARGIFESIYWHLGMKYTIDRIHILRPMGYDEARDHDLPLINLVGIRRNEVTEKISARNVRQAAQGSSRARASSRANTRLMAGPPSPLPRPAFPAPPGPGGSPR